MAQTMKFLCCSNLMLALAFCEIAPAAPHIPWVHKASNKSYPLFVVELGEVSILRLEPLAPSMLPNSKICMATMYPYNPTLNPKPESLGPTLKTYHVARDSGFR